VKCSMGRFAYVGSDVNCLEVKRFRIKLCKNKKKGKVFSVD
jgi:hypothetical protein